MTASTDLSVFARMFTVVIMMAVDSLAHSNDWSGNFPVADLVPLHLPQSVFSSVRTGLYSG